MALIPLNMVYVTDEDANFSAYVGITEDDALLATFNGEEPGIEEVLTDEQKIQVISGWLFSDPIEDCPPWGYKSVVQLDGKGEIIYNHAFAPPWQKIGIAKTGYIAMYEENFPQYDWNAVRKWGDSRLIELYDIHTHCEEEISDWGGDSMADWMEVIQSERFWDGIIPLKDSQ